MAKKKPTKPAPKPKPAFKVEVCCDDSAVAAAIQKRIDAHLSKGRG